MHINLCSYQFAKLCSFLRFDIHRRKHSTQHCHISLCFLFLCFLAWLIYGSGSRGKAWSVCGWWVQIECVFGPIVNIETHKSIKTSGLLPVHRKDREDRWLDFVWPFANVVWSRIRSAVTCFTRAQEEPERHPKTVGKVSICWLLFSKTASEKHLWYIFKWNKIFFSWFYPFYSISQDQENTVRQSSCWRFWFRLQERGFQSHGRPSTRLPGHWFFSTVSQLLHFRDIRKHLHSCFSFSTFVFCSDMNAPFSKWSCDQVCAWMEDFGLGQYVQMARQWVTSGQTLLSASSQDMEKVRDTRFQHMFERLWDEEITNSHPCFNNLMSSCNTWRLL